MGKDISARVIERVLPRARGAHHGFMAEPIVWPLNASQARYADGIDE